MKDVKISEMKLEIRRNITENEAARSEITETVRKRKAEHMRDRKKDDSYQKKRRGRRGYGVGS